MTTERERKVYELVKKQVVLVGHNSLDSRRDIAKGGFILPAFCSIQYVDVLFIFLLIMAEWRRSIARDCSKNVWHRIGTYPKAQRVLRLPGPVVGLPPPSPSSSLRQHNHHQSPPPRCRSSLYVPPPWQKREES